MQTTPNKIQKKGFTLVELLIVVAILAILSSATFIILNPVQRFQESRDTVRLNDIASINTAIGYYLLNATTPTFGGTWRCTMAVVAAPCDTATSNVIRLIDGTGWVDINLVGFSTGISSLPFDPIGTQTAALHYTARTNNTAKTWELTAQMESTKYSNTGTSDRESTDGGNNADCLEVGTDLTLVDATHC